MPACTRKAEPVTNTPIQRITAEEAVAALTAGAWHESPSGEDYEQAVAAVLLLAKDTDGSNLPPGSQIPAGEIVRAIHEALGEQRSIVHCIMSFTGADWDLESAVALARKPDAKCAWLDGPAHHDLGIFADGRRHHFDVRRPETEG